MKIQKVAALISVCVCSQAYAGEDAPVAVLQGTTVFANSDASLSAPWLETSTYPNGGAFRGALRSNLSKQVILIEAGLDLGSNKEESAFDTITLKSHAGFSVGPTSRVNYGIMHMEATFQLGVRGYVFAHTSKKFNEESNAYAMRSWGMNGNISLRLGVKSFFLGTGLELENPIGGQPEGVGPAISYANGSLDTSNAGKWSKNPGTTRLNVLISGGVWL